VSAGPPDPVAGAIGPCGADDAAEILEIVNAAARRAYRGVIPEDLWSEPYMEEGELRAELDAGVRFSGWRHRGRLLGVMGVQDAGDVRLIRHAYVRPEAQGRGIGGRLLEHLLGSGDGPFLVGTWAAAGQAVRFYRRHGFRMLDPDEATRLLGRYWSIPERQVETSVVLAGPGWSG